MNSYSLTFDGKLLDRGFWIYVWEISHLGKKCLYIGRTGDSSSPNAASPFSRISGHLNKSDNAKGNSLYKALTKERLDPSKCKYHFAAFGPIYGEPHEKNMEKHKPFRDRMAAFEFALYQAFKDKNITVLGKHGSKHKISKDDQDSFKKILIWINDEFGISLQEAT